MAMMTAVHQPVMWGGLRAVPGGIDPDAPAMVYLVRHDAQAALGVGVSGPRSDRLDELESLGWQLVRGWWFDLGFDALEAAERLIDRWQHLFSLRPRLDLDEMLGAGSTTVVDASRATEGDAAAFVDVQWRSLEPASAESALDTVAFPDGFPDPWLLAG